jgi:hypothetical protein
MVHFRSVPAGRTVSRALALVARTRVKARRDTARTAYELDFITHLGLTPWNFYSLFPSYYEPAPMEGVKHKLTVGSIDIEEKNVSLPPQQMTGLVLRRIFWHITPPPPQFAGKY